MERLLGRIIGCDTTYAKQWRDSITRANAGGDQHRGASSICIVVYVTKHCATCEYADQVVDTICRDFPQVDVRIVDLEITLEAIPEVVFATPTYLLNGRIWSLGSYIPLHGNFFTNLPKKYNRSIP